MGVDYSGLEAYRDKIEALINDSDIIESCAKELAARFLRAVTKRTPVDTGNLRRNWAGRASSSNPDNYSMQVHHVGNKYWITVTNNTEYASYVEYGHRTRNGGGWVPGQFFMTISEQEIQSKSTAIISKKFEMALRKALS